MARLSKETIAKADARVKADPRGAPITLPPDNPTPLAEDALNAPDPAPATAKEQGPRCVLDDYPVNSELVVLQYPGEQPLPWLQTPAGRKDVPRGDLAWKLPVEAEIRRTGPATFVARQRGAVDDRKDLICATATECARQFKKHFHDERD